MSSDTTEKTSESRFKLLRYLTIAKVKLKSIPFKRDCTKEIVIFFSAYTFFFIVLLITILVAFLHVPVSNITYLKWYNDKCSTDGIANDCDRNLRLSCNYGVCSCSKNMYWNSSFCDCSTGLFWNGDNCQIRQVYNQSCNNITAPCMEYLYCNPVSRMCECSQNTYYNQTTCNLKLGYNSSTSCMLTSQCQDYVGLICSGSACICSNSMYWNGAVCDNLSTYGQYCGGGQQCATSLSCNLLYNLCTCPANYFWDGLICRQTYTNGTTCTNIQQCMSGLVCMSNQCQCPLTSTQYWDGSSCQLCYGIDLFLFAGICYHITPPTNATYGNYSMLITNKLSTIEYDYQFDYLYIQHFRVYNQHPIYLASNNPLSNYFQWSYGTTIKRSYFCNGTQTSNYTNYRLSYNIQTNTKCLIATSTSTIGQLATNVNNYNLYVL